MNGRTKEIVLEATDPLIIKQKLKYVTITSRHKETKWEYGNCQLSGNTLHPHFFLTLPDFDVILTNFEIF